MRLSSCILLTSMGTTTPWRKRRDSNSRYITAQGISSASPSTTRTLFHGADSRVRTDDIQFGKLTLYQLSYARMEPLIRFERMTGSLQNCCSTPELKWLMVGDQGLEP